MDDATNPANDIPLESIGEVVAFRLSPTESLREGIEKVRMALELAVAHGHPALLLDMRAFEGANPDMASRHEFLRAWAAAAEGGRVRVAMLLAPQYIDPERFGVVAARNFGMVADVFSDEGQALRWLRETGPG
jgi:hypothetical protein